MEESSAKHGWDDPNFQEAREHFRAGKEAMREAFEAWMPPGVVEQRRKARREFLLAARSLIDAALAHTEKSQKAG